LDGAAAEDGAGVDGTAAQYETGAGDGTDPFENDNGRPP
jgi:hypothetical protein